MPTSLPPLLLRKTTSVGWAGFGYESFNNLEKLQDRPFIQRFNLWVERMKTIVVAIEIISDTRFKSNIDSIPYNKERNILKLRKWVS